MLQKPEGLSHKVKCCYISIPDVRFLAQLDGYSDHWKKKPNRHRIISFAKPQET